MPMTDKMSKILNILAIILICLWLPYFILGKYLNSWVGLTLVESEEHELIRTRVAGKLKEWFDASVQNEYLHSGYRFDVYGVLPNSMRFHAEIIWSFSKTNFNEAIKKLLVSDANVKVLIAHPRFQEKHFVREYDKFSIASRRNRVIVDSSMLDADAILHDDSYTNTRFRSLIDTLIELSSAQAYILSLSLSEKEKIEKVFVPPKEFQIAKDILTKFGFIIITGPPHIGKTALATFLQIESEKIGYASGQLLSRDPEQISTILRHSRNKALRIDDIFGSIDLTQTDLANYLTEILRQLQPGNRLLITSRGYIMEKAYRVTRLGESYPFLQQFIVDLGTHRTKKELVEILERHMRYYGCSPDLYKFVMEKADEVVKRLPFPHNLDIFARQLCAIGTSENVEKIIDSSEQIEIAVENWFHAMIHEGLLEEAYTTLILSLPETFMNSEQARSVYKALLTQIRKDQGIRDFDDVIRHLVEHKLITTSPSLGRSENEKTITFLHPAYQEATRNIIAKSTTYQRLVLGAYSECDDEYAKLGAVRFLLENVDKLNTDMMGFLEILSDLHDRYCAIRFATILVSENGKFLRNERIRNTLKGLIEREDTRSNLIVDNLVPHLTYLPEDLRAFLQGNTSFRRMMINSLKKRTLSIQEKWDLTLFFEICDVVEEKFLHPVDLNDLCRALQVKCTSTLRIHLARLLISRINSNTVSGAIARSLKSHIIALAHDSDAEVRCSIGVAVACSFKRLPNDFQDILSLLKSDSETKVRETVSHAIAMRQFVEG